MIIRLELQILAAVILDMLFGDPWQLPHPVQGIGWAVRKVESLTRRMIPNPRKAGVITWLFISAGTGGLTLLAVRLLYLVHPLAGDICSILLLYTTIAARDLIKHGSYIRKGLISEPLESARKRLSLIVSRDTNNLSEQQVILSTIESIAENISDGIVAPLFFAFLGGPALAMTYKAVSTMDSMVGYKNRRYLKFGWFAARADDVFNFIPARLSAALLWLSAGLPGLNMKGAGRILARDSRKSASPNAGWPESVVAGALGLRFGGEIWYFNKPCIKDYIGDETETPGPHHILLAVRMLISALILTVILGTGIRFGLSLL